MVVEDDKSAKKNFKLSQIFQWKLGGNHLPKEGSLVESLGEIPLILYLTFSRTRRIKYASSILIYPKSSVQGGTSYL